MVPTELGLMFAQVRVNNSPVRTSFAQVAVGECDRPTQEEAEADQRGNLIEIVSTEPSIRLRPGANLIQLPTSSTIGTDGRRRPLTSGELDARLRRYEDEINAQRGVLVGQFTEIILPERQVFAVSNGPLETRRVLLINSTQAGTDRL